MTVRERREGRKQKDVEKAGHRGPGEEFAEERPGERTERENARSAEPASESIERGETVAARARRKEANLSAAAEGRGSFVLCLFSFLGDRRAGARTLATASARKRSLPMRFSSQDIRLETSSRKRLFAALSSRRSCFGRRHSR